MIEESLIWIGQCRSIRLSPARPEINGDEISGLTGNPDLSRSCRTLFLATMNLPVLYAFSHHAPAFRIRFSGLTEPPWPGLYVLSMTINRSHMSLIR